MSWPRGGAGGGAGGGGPCAAYLGIGHMHRGEGERNRRKYRRAPTGKPPWAGANRPAELRRRQPFSFGYRYTHFFYALEPHAPFRVVATSREFCLAAEQDAADCESIQFVSGLSLAPGGATLLLSYGVNDCEARVGRVALARVWRMLRPSEGATGVCEDTFNDAN